MTDPKDHDRQDDDGTDEDLPDGSGPSGHRTQSDGDPDQFQG